jgi:hypothetical protein
MRLKAIHVVILMGVLPWPGLASVITYGGFDLNAFPGQPAPNSTAAAAAFTAAAGPLRTITFEEELLGPIPGMRVLSDGTVLTEVQVAQGVVVEDFIHPDVRQWNTTPGGKTYLELSGLDPALSRFRFTFPFPTLAFGAYFTGITNQLGVHFLTLDDGAPQSLFVLSNLTLETQLSFFGFVSTGTPFTSITLETRGSPINDYIIGIDDLQYAAVPEPSALALFLGGVAMLAFGRACGIVRKSRLQG